MFARFILSLLLVLPAAPVFAFSKDIEVTDVRFDADYKTAYISLSEKPDELVHIAYDLYVGNATDAHAGGGWNIDDQFPALGGFVNAFEELGGEGTRFRLQFRVCPYNEPYTGQHRYEYCGREFVTYVTYEPNAEDTYPTIERATFTQDRSSIIVELSEPLRAGFILYERWGSAGGADYSSGQYRADHQQTATLTGVGKQFEYSGTAGVQTITLRPCTEPRGSDYICGDPYTISIDLGGSSSFEDVPSSHPNAEAIAYVQREGIVAGYPSGTFKPDIGINRAEFTKIITLALYGQQEIDRCGAVGMFSDIPRDAWYRAYLCSAFERRLLSGYPDGTFKPGNFILFTEAAKILANGYGLTAEDGNSSIPWYERYVRALAEQNAIPMTVWRFDDLMSRGEMAEIIYRLNAGITNQPSRTYEWMVGNSRS